MNLRQAIQQASRTADLDDALSGIMQVLGVTTGDRAGQMFSSVADGDAFNSDYWPQASPQERAVALVKYVDAEMGQLFGEMGVESGGRRFMESAPVEQFDPYTDPDTRAMLERAGIATHRYRR